MLTLLMTGRLRRPRRTSSVYGRSLAKAIDPRDRGTVGMSFEEPGPTNLFGEPEEPSASLVRKKPVAVSVPAAQHEQQMQADRAASKDWLRQRLTEIPHHVHSLDDAVHYHNQHLVNAPVHAGMERYEASRALGEHAQQFAAKEPDAVVASDRFRSAEHDPKTYRVTRRGGDISDSLSTGTISQGKIRKPFEHDGNLYTGTWRAGDEVGAAHVVPRDQYTGPLLEGGAQHHLRVGMSVSHGGKQYVLTGAKRTFRSEPIKAGSVQAVVKSAFRAGLRKGMNQRQPPTANAPGLPYDKEVTHITTPEGAHGILANGFDTSSRGGINGDTPNDFGPGLYAADANSDMAGFWRHQLETSGESGDRQSTAMRGRMRLEKPLYVDDKHYGPGGRSTPIPHRQFLEHGHPADETPGCPEALPHYDAAVAAGRPSGHALAVAAQATGHDGLVVRRYQGEEAVSFRPDAVTWTHQDGVPLRMEPTQKALSIHTAHVDQQASDAQKEAGNYRMAHVRWKGLELTIENPRGSVRTKTSAASGKTWSRTMAHHYGYIRETRGVDGDHVDCFLGPDEDSDHVFVVHQVDYKGKFDEHKVMLGFSTEAAARKGYLANFDKGWKVGPIEAMTVAGFKQWMQQEGLQKAAESGRELAPWQKSQQRHHENLANKRQETVDFMQRRHDDGDLPPEHRARLREQIAGDAQEIARLRTPPDPADADYLYHSSPALPAIRRSGLRSAGYHDSATGETQKRHVAWVTDDDQGARMQGHGGYGGVVRVPKSSLGALGLQVGESADGESLIQRPDGKPFRIPAEHLHEYSPEHQAWQPVPGAAAAQIATKQSGAGRLLTKQDLNEIAGHIHHPGTGRYFTRETLKEAADKVRAKLPLTKGDMLSQMLKAIDPKDTDTASLNFSDPAPLVATSAPAAKIWNGCHIEDEFVSRDGKTRHCLQVHDSGHSGAITTHSRVDNKRYRSFGKPSHGYDATGPIDFVRKQWAVIKKDHGIPAVKAIDPKDTGTGSLELGAPSIRSPKPRHSDADRAQNLGAGLQGRYDRAEHAFRSSMEESGHYDKRAINGAVKDALRNVSHGHFLSDGRMYLHHELHGAHQTLQDHLASPVKTNENPPAYTPSSVRYPTWEEKHPGKTFDGTYSGPPETEVSKAFRVGLRLVKGQDPSPAGQAVGSEILHSAFGEGLRIVP
jgi:hypothetical protein